MTEERLCQLAKYLKLLHTLNRTFKVQLVGGSDDINIYDPDEDRYIGEFSDGTDYTMSFIFLDKADPEPETTDKNNQVNPMPSFIASDDANYE